MDLGNLGESILKIWCFEENLTVNSSQIDRNGWDALIEFPSSNNNNEIHEAPLECKIQVKSTLKRDGKWPIKLSNMRKMVTSPVPYFILVLEFKNDGQVENSFLIHINSVHINQTLQRLQKAKSDGTLNKINKQSITINYNESHKLQKNDGMHLKKAIESHIPNGLSQYSEWKTSQLKNAGYENGKLRLKFQTKGEKNLEELIDASIGLRKDVKIHGLTHSEVRFNIEIPDQELNLSEATLEFIDLQPTKTGLISFKKSKFSPRISFNCNIYSSPFNIFAPQSHAKIRIETEFFDLIFKLNNTKFDINFKVDTKFEYDINNLYNFHILLDFLNENCNFLIEIITDKYTEQDAIYFNASGYIIENSYTDFKELIHKAKFILNYFNETTKTKTTIREIYFNKKNIEALFSLIQPEKPFLKFVCEELIEIQENQHVSLTIPFITKICNAYYIIIISMQGKIHISNKCSQLISKKLH